MKSWACRSWSALYSAVGETRGAGGPVAATPRHIAHLQEPQHDPLRRMSNMKRNMDLCRKILIEVESWPTTLESKEARDPMKAGRYQHGDGGMIEPRLFSVYCDESCHLEHDGVPVMAWGGGYCPADGSRAIAEAVRALKAEHGLAHDCEAKWTKVSPAKVDFYLALMDLFLADERLRFRGLVVPDKKLLDHARFDQSHNDWYYKIYFTMLRPIVFG